MNFDDIMAQLRVEYIASLSEKVRLIELAHQKKDYHPVKEIFHKLKGTGTTYGIPELSQLGEVIETLCEQKSKELAWVVPSAVDLLKTIQRQRAKNHPVILEQNETFSKIAKVRT